MTSLDHLLWAAPDLEAGIERMYERTGIRAALGGEHPGMGTRNALIGLGARRYLEILSPDPTQTLQGTLGATIAALPDPTLYTFAARSHRIEGDVDRVTAVGASAPRIVDMSRNHRDGRLLRWRVAMIGGHAFGPLVPFLIEWGATPHPADEAPAGCELLAFEVAHPEAAQLARLYDALQLDVKVVESREPGLRATLRTPRGRVQL